MPIISQMAVSGHSSITQRRHTATDYFARGCFAHYFAELTLNDALTLSKSLFLEVPQLLCRKQPLCYPNAATLSVCSAEFTAWASFQAKAPTVMTLAPAFIQMSEPYCTKWRPILGGWFPTFPP